MNLRTQIRTRAAGWVARCPYCHAPATSPTTACGICAASHHTDCWELHLGCASCPRRGRRPRLAPPPTRRAPARRFAPRRVRELLDSLVSACVVVGAVGLLVFSLAGCSRLLLLYAIGMAPGALLEGLSWALACSGTALTITAELRRPGGQV